MTIETDITNKQRLREIKRFLPHPIRSVVYHDKGENFSVIEINDKWMFRFPRSVRQKEELFKETAFLRRFEGCSPLLVPLHKFNTTTCVGYRKISGTELTRELLLSFPADMQKSIARQLGEFLSVLHSFPLTELVAVNLTPGWGSWRQRARVVFEQKLLPLFSPKERANIASWFKDFFAMKFKEVVVHGDFTPDHIICDPQRRRVVGIIDWGDVTIDDASTDLYHLQQEYWQHFCEQVLAHWRAQMDTGIRERIAVRLRAERFFTMVYFYERGFDRQLRKEIAVVKRACSDDASHNENVRSQGSDN